MVAADALNVPEGSSGVRGSPTPSPLLSSSGIGGDDCITPLAERQGMQPLQPWVSHGL